MTMSAAFHANADTKVTFDHGKSNSWLTLEGGSGHVDVYAGDDLDAQIAFAWKLSSAVFAWHKELVEQRDALQRRLDAME